MYHIKQLFNGEVPSISLSAAFISEMDLIKTLYLEVLYWQFYEHYAQY